MKVSHMILASATVYSPFQNGSQMNLGQMPFAHFNTNLAIFHEIIARDFPYY